MRQNCSSQKQAAPQQPTVDLPHARLLLTERLAVLVAGCILSKHAEVPACLVGGRDGVRRYCTMPAAPSDEAACDDSPSSCRRCSARRL